MNHRCTESRASLYSVPLHSFVVVETSGSVDNGWIKGQLAALSKPVLLCLVLIDLPSAGQELLSPSVFLVSNLTFESWRLRGNETKAMCAEMLTHWPHKRAQSRPAEPNFPL